MTRRARLWEWADERHVPLQAILITVGVVVVTLMAGKIVYKLREILLLMAVAGFIALLLNPLVVLLQRVGVARRGFAVAIVTVFAVLVFAGLAYAFGAPLANGLTHLISKLPSYVQSAEHGKGWIGHLVRKYHVQHWVRAEPPQAPELRQEPLQAGAEARGRRLHRRLRRLRGVHPRAAAPARGAQAARRGPAALRSDRAPHGSPGSPERSTARSPASCSATSSPRSSPGWSSS